MIVCVMELKYEKWDNGMIKYIKCIWRGLFKNRIWWMLGNIFDDVYYNIFLWIFVFLVVKDDYEFKLVNFVCSFCIFCFCVNGFII